MWERKELKAKGKAAFKANYWKCVLVAFILVALVGGGVASSQVGSEPADGVPQEATAFLEEFNAAPEEAQRAIAQSLLAMLAGFTAVGAVISCVINLLVINPLAVGGSRFFLANSAEPAGLGELGYGFKKGYGRVVAGMFLTSLFTFLWSLLLLVPGIIKAYSYRMVPYILADDPSIGGKDAITRSREMMNGQKWNTFVLDLSFLGWWLLACVTLGFAGVFWVSPYIEATNAELYKALKGEPETVEELEAPEAAE
ncbi:MAG: DUF975 family protein [Oscillospiraceae bacterium]|nr:DUF975 family protein [Oscillospiraceae bacterium]